MTTNTPGTWSEVKKMAIEALNGAKEGSISSLEIFHQGDHYQLSITGEGATAGETKGKGKGKKK